jgi:hypothetical protein
MTLPEPKIRFRNPYFKGREINLTYLNEIAMQSR